MTGLLASSPSRANCRILADDLTGALDTVCAFSGGSEVPVRFGALELSSSSSPVEVCDLASRALPAPALHEALAASVDWLAQARLCFKKIDSLLRGNSFAEIAWLAGSGRFRRLVVSPAFPAQGRFVRNGRLMVAGHAAGPPLLDALKALGVQPRPDGGGTFGECEIVMPDVASAAELDELVRLHAAESDLGNVLWCGSAGLALALSRFHGLASPPGSRAQRPRAARVLVATGTCHPVLLAQLLRLRTRVPVARHVRIEHFIRSDVQLTEEQAAAALAEGARGVVASCSAVPPDLLLVIGGDSLLALCRAAGATAMLAGPSPRPGWGSARLVGGRWDGLRCLSRSGAFGAADDLVDLLDSIEPAPLPLNSDSKESTVNP